MALLSLIDQLLQSAQLALVTVMPAANPLTKWQPHIAVYTMAMEQLDQSHPIAHLEGTCIHLPSIVDEDESWVSAR
jgi:hypothetical protein